MLACSESLGQLAGALARAQLQLTNPQKTLTATLDQPGRAGSRQTYRYAPLSSGLEIIRKALGEQEIAVLQTTSVAQGREVLELTTTLVHGSGEWVATTWPVCRLGDISDPKLMGAALTYARRYSLFALVGITGEDDLDAPEPEGGAVRQRELGDERGRPATRGQVHAPREAGSSAAAPLSRVRGRVHGRTQARAPSPTPGMQVDAPSAPAVGSELIARLEAAQDEAALLDWAREAMLTRARLGESERDSLDQAFLRRAEMLGLDREILCAFSSQAEPGSDLLNPSPASLSGGPDAQASL